MKPLSTLLCTSLLLLGLIRSCTAGSSQIWTGTTSVKWTYYKAMKLTWGKAAQFCTDRGARLPTLNSDLAMKAFQEATSTTFDGFSQTNNVDAAWIGLHTYKIKNFLRAWQGSCDGFRQGLAGYWDPYANEPDDQSTSLCVRLHETSLMWRTKGCDNKMAVVCEFQQGNCSYTVMPNNVISKEPAAVLITCTFNITTCWAACRQLILGGSECVAAALTSAGLCKLYLGNELLADSEISVDDSVSTTLLRKVCFTTRINSKTFSSQSAEFCPSNDVINFIEEDIVPEGVELVSGNWWIANGHCEMSETTTPVETTSTVATTHAETTELTTHAETTELTTHAETTELTTHAETTELTTHAETTELTTETETIQPTTETETTELTTETETIQPTTETETTELITETETTELTIQKETTEATTEAETTEPTTEAETTSKDTTTQHETTSTTRMTSEEKFTSTETFEETTPATLGAPPPTPHTNFCSCSCAQQTLALPTDPAATQVLKEQLSAEIKRELTVESSLLSKQVNKKISVPDSRSSSVSMGVVSVLFIGSVLGGLIVSDLFAAVRWMYGRCKECNREQLYLGE